MSAPRRMRPPIRSDRSKMNGPLNHGDGGKTRLFPRRFIISLPAPSNYVGPDLVFGSNHEDGMKAPLPLIRHVDQRAEGWIAEGHKSNRLVAIRNEACIIGNRLGIRPVRTRPA